MTPSAKLKNPNRSQIRKDAPGYEAATRRISLVETRASSLIKFAVVSLHKKEKKCQERRRKELFYYATSGSNVTRDVQ